MENKKEKALELYASPEICRCIKEMGLREGLSLFLSRILIDLMECLVANDASLETRMVLLSLIAKNELNINTSKDENGKIRFNVNWDEKNNKSSDKDDKMEDFNKWINDFGDGYDKTN